MSAYHIPVLLNESVDGLKIKPKGIYVDVTYGGGGHSAEILKRLTGGKLYAFDQDADAATNLSGNKKFCFIHGNFRFLKNYLNYYHVERIDGLLADLGVSSHHFNTPDRGFTYRSEARLDMRMNRDSGVTAEMIINEYDVRQLTEVFRKYGELQQARKLAAAITVARAKQKIETSEGLVECIARLVPKQNENQFLSRVFQAIRIEVNRELENLKDLLYSSGDMLNPGGRLVIISYHSLEDRLVKNFMRWGNTEESPEKDLFGNAPTPFNIITRKPVVAGEIEVAANPRARSALLRIAEKN